jgi:hypothetical protein
MGLKALSDARKAIGEALAIEEARPQPASTAQYASPSLCWATTALAL